MVQFAYELTSDDIIDVARLHLRIRWGVRYFIISACLLPLLAINGIIMTLSFHLAVYWWCLIGVLGARSFMNSQTDWVVRAYARFIQRPFQDRPDLARLFYGQYNLTVGEEYINIISPNRRSVLRWLCFRSIAMDCNGASFQLIQPVGSEVIFVPRRAFDEVHQFVQFVHYCEGRIASAARASQQA